MTETVAWAIKCIRPEYLDKDSIRSTRRETIINFVRRFENIPEKELLRTLDDDALDKILEDVTPEIDVKVIPVEVSEIY